MAKSSGNTRHTAALTASDKMKLQRQALTAARRYVDSLGNPMRESTVVKDFERVMRKAFQTQVFNIEQTIKASERMKKIFTPKSSVWAMHDKIIKIAKTIINNRK